RRGELREGDGRSLVDRDFPAGPPLEQRRGEPLLLLEPRVRDLARRRRKLPEQGALAFGRNLGEGFEVDVEYPLGHGGSAAGSPTGQAGEDRTEREPQHDRLRRADELGG